jgi:hypothetical protein
MMWLQSDSLRPSSDFKTGFGMQTATYYLHDTIPVAVPETALISAHRRFPAEVMR